MWHLRFLVYLFEVSISLFAFYALYIFILKRLTFFKINRIYLVSALLFSFVIPSVKIELQHNHANFTAASKLSDQVEQFTTVSFHPIAGTDQTAFSLADCIFYIYLLIALLLLLRGLSHAVELFRHTKKISAAVNGLKVIYKYSGFVNCSFFNYVFINPATISGRETAMLLQHEQVHAKQWHSADQLLLLLGKIILWFNPLIYWYAAAVEQANEFEADAATLKTEDAKVYAQLLLKMATGKETNALTHHFGKHPVKERIVMLFTDRSKTMSISAYALIIPLFMGLISSFSIKIASAYPLSKSAFTLLLDPGHGGTDGGALAGNLTEKQLTLAIVKKIRSVAASKGLKVVMTRNDDSNVTLKQRGNSKGDVLLSIHYNTSADQNKSGIEIISGNSSITSRRSVIKNLTVDLYQYLQLLEGIHTENLSREVTGSYLLEKSTAPSILLELGYLSNTSDKKFITSPVHQQELAQAIVNSVLAYRDTQRPQK